MSAETEGAAFGRGNKDHRASPRVLPVGGVAKLVTKWSPHPAQRRMLAVDRGVVLSSGALGSGKSEPGALMLLRWALRFPRRDGQPTQWYAVAPDFRRIKRELFRKLLGHLRRLPVNVVKRVTFGQDAKIVLQHGQVIFGCSATDPDRLRGYEIDGLWIDEAQKIDEKAFRIAVSRLRSTDAVRVVITGSPEDVPSWNWNLISGQSEPHNKIREQLLQSGSGFWCFRWSSSENKSNSSEVLGTVKAVMEASGQGLAAQELEGRFPGTHEAPVAGAIDFAKAFVGRLVLDAEGSRAAVLGVDLGMTTDFTWLTVLSRTGVVLAMDRFNVSTPGIPREDFYPRVEERIARWIDDWRIPLTKMDTAMSGSALAQYLARALGARAKVEGYRTDANRRKAEAIEALGVALGRQSIRIPTSWIGPDGVERRVNFVDHLRRELSELQVEQHGGYRTFDHPPGGHDDGVVSLALACQGISLRRSEVDLSPWFKGNKLQVPGSKWATPYGPGYNLGGGRAFPPRPWGR